jgi:transposase
MPSGFYDASGVVFRGVFRFAFMVIQTRFGTGSVKPNGNKSVSCGLIRTCGTVLRMLGISDLLKGMKSKGVGLDVIVELVCAYPLQGGSSMNECADWLDDEVLRTKLCGGETISQRTIDRSLAVLSDNFEDITDGIWNGINRIFDIECTDVVVDGSHIPVVGRMNTLSAYGHGGHGIQNQVQFMLGMLRCPTLPFDIMPYPGNMTDQEQYRRFLPRMFKRMTPGSLIVVDNGCAHKDLKKMIADAGMEYLTRERMNHSDDRRIDEHPEDSHTSIWTYAVSSTYSPYPAGRTICSFLSRTTSAGCRSPSRRKRNAPR